MIRRYTSIIGMPLLDFDEGQTLALLRDIIVNPNNGKIEAFWVKPVGNMFANLIVQTQDIMEWKKKIYIRNEGMMANPEDVLRVVEVLEQKTPIVDQVVMGQSGQSYGVVSDLEFDDSTYGLRQIYVQKRFLSLFAYAQVQFSFKKILEITSEKIVVDDDARSKSAVVAPTLSGV